MPRDTPLPFLLTVALSVGFTGALLQAWWIVGIAGAGVLASLVVWLWPARLRTGGAHG